MRTFAHTYTYLVGSLFLLTLFAIAFWRCRSQRRQILCGGLLSAPSGFCASLFVPEYWQPQQLFRFGAGPEDLIFSFANGGLVWLVVAAVYTRRSREVRIELLPTLRRWFVISAIFCPLWVLLQAAGLSVMEAGILAALAILAALLGRRPGALRLAVAGAVLFTTPYLLLTALLFHLFPGFLSQWNLAELSGGFVLGVPLEEVSWALTWGACWPVVLAYMIDLPVHGTLPGRTGPTAVRQAGTA